MKQWKISVILLALFLLTSKAEAKTLYGYHCGFYNPTNGGCYSPKYGYGHYSRWQWRSHNRVVRRSSESSVIRSQRRWMKWQRQEIRRDYWRKRLWKENRGRWNRVNNCRRLRRR